MDRGNKASSTHIYQQRQLFSSVSRNSSRLLSLIPVTSLLLTAVTSANPIDTGKQFFEGVTYGIRILYCCLYVEEI